MIPVDTISQNQNNGILVVRTFVAAAGLQRTVARRELDAIRLSKAQEPRTSPDIGPDPRHRRRAKKNAVSANKISAKASHFLGELEL